MIFLMGENRNPAPVASVDLSTEFDELFSIGAERPEPEMTREV